MAPSVSRMEPIGLSLAPKDEPRATKVLEPAQERPRLVPQPKDNPVQVASTPRANPGGSLSAPPSSGSKPPPLTNPDSTGAITYTVLLGSFGKAENAERLRLRMVEAGLPVSVSQVKSTDDKVWYRVMSGNFNTENQANAYSRELRDKNLTDQTFIFKNK
jgi:cell division protein FtsN